MFSITAVAIVCLLLLQGLLADVSKPCYDYEASHKEIKAICRECKKTPNKTEMYKCINKKMKVVDEEGNILASKIRDLYLADLDEAKVEAMKEGIKDCGMGTGPLKLTDENKAAIGKIWACVDEAMVKICPEANEARMLLDNDEDVKECMIE